MPESEPPFRDPRLPVADRIDDLLTRLTPEERIAMLHQFAPAVDRLGVAAFRTGQEALHGVAWMGPATVFPQAVGLGATWNDDLVRRVGEAVGAEVRAMRARDDRVGLNVWAPTVNLLRNPLWGRNEEGYSEDPALTSAIAVAYTRGLRGDHPRYWRTAPVLKHWLAHNNETDRATSSASVRPRVLHEYDLRAFRPAVEAGAVAGVMPAYNLVNGRPNHLSPELRTRLRTWTDQHLLVCSDAGAPTNLVDAEHCFDTHEEATAAALRAGVDSFTDHGQDPGPITARVRGALDRGLIDPSHVDTAVRRLLAVRFALGEFDPDLDPYAGPQPFDTPEHRALALEAAEQAVVLLKNVPVGDSPAGPPARGAGPLLPLAEGTRLAVVGPLADECKLDWYSGTLLHRSTPFTGLRERFGADAVQLAEGLDLVRLHTASGTLRVPDASTSAPDPASGSEAALDPALLRGRTDLPPLTCDATGTVFALADWGGGVVTLRAPDGRYLTVADDGCLRAAADRPGGWVVQETFRLEPHGDGHLLVHLGTGRPVHVTDGGVRVGATGDVFRVETVEHGTDAVTRAAAEADVVVVVAGNDPHINGRETEDRSTLALPEQQERIWRAARAANPRTVLVLSSSYPYAVPEAAAELPALLWTAHGGQAAGTALARVLAGDVSPAGRLPQTWYAADKDLPDLLDYDIVGSRQTYLYFTGTPLYPFGHGLGYTTFTHAGLTARVDGGTVHAALTVTNTGPVASDEVAQLYARATAPSVPRPGRELVAHRRVHLAPGESARLDFEVPLAALGHWDVAHGRWTVEPGRYELLAGPSSADPHCTAALTVDGERAGPRPVPSAGLEAADYDEQHATVLVARSTTDGTAVAPDGDDPGELLYRRCDFGDGVTTVALLVAATGPGSVELAAGPPLEGTSPVGATPSGADPDASTTVGVPATGGVHEFTALHTGIRLDGVRDLRLTLRGPVRLARLDFLRPGDRRHPTTARNS
ncbi:glycoside hydrolase family 3 C-terminal domain-containing protein [Streptomyces sp. 549]|uniref:glycoside hydrolase family 3 C-terminal domain-containing protein n=1 Tax=Streptomyces sp. 549 TaxID=3049076 RepID=UPI0024C424B9|nr:glycoside hydrolase family 3 C-terminal domain-containing protein [Streptomyces sp. 549]MDK1472420.1 glycoside hydrolase family 3 C-terminal domain-containing protein [Streptomyces sp. 549]